MRCVECNTDISHKRAGTRFCGQRCRDRSRWTNHVDRPAVRLCSHCRAEISDRHLLATRCEECQASHRKSRKHLVVRSCAVCGTDLTGTTKKKLCAACSAPKQRTCAEDGCEVDLTRSRRQRCLQHGRERALEAQRARQGGENRKAYNEAIRQWQADNPEATMLIRARTRAKKRGLECTITVDDVKAAWPEAQPVPCVRHGAGQESGPGALVTRITEPGPHRQHQGYVPGNIWVISLEANGTKRDLTIEELAAGESTPEWQAWARDHLAGKSRPRRRVVRRSAA